MNDRDEILTLAEAVLVSKLSRATLYRVAEAGLRGEDSPFRKVRGRWLTTRGDLAAWVRRQPGGRSTSADPMPESSAGGGESVDDLLATVHDLRSAA